MKNKTFCFQKMDFLSIGQKDAQWSVSPLRVRMKRVWARRARLAAVFGGSLILVEFWTFGRILDTMDTMDRVWPHS